MSYLGQKHENLRQLTLKDVKKHILGPGYFHDGYVLPGKLHTGGLLVELPAIDWEVKSPKTPVARTNSLDIVVDKSNHGVRRYSLVHPYIYIHLANEVLQNFDRIRDRLLEETSVAVYSLPTFVADKAVNQDWEHFSRIAPSESFWKDYSYVVNADIHNFYESIYTHSISWAIEGKDAAKDNRGTSLLGNRVDRFFQNAHDGQTNGIPTGNVLSDIAAELILMDIDKLISPVLEKHGIRAFRYRDDYRFLCRTKGDALAIMDTLAFQLNSEYGLTLNKTKTKIQTTAAYTKSIVTPYPTPKLLDPKNDISTLSWYELHEFLVECRSADSSKRGLFDTHIESLMARVKERSTPLLVEDSIDEWVDSLYATIIDAIESGISTSPHIYFILDLILKKLEGSGKVLAITDDLARRVTNGHNEVRIAWTYTVLARYNSASAISLASTSNSKLLAFMFDSDTPDIEKFTTRDLMPEEHLIPLRTVKLFDFELINRIESIDVDDLFIDSISDEFFESLSLSRYLNR